MLNKFFSSGPERRFDGQYCECDSNNCPRFNGNVCNCKLFRIKGTKIKVFKIQCIFKEFFR